MCAHSRPACARRLPGWASRPSLRMSEASSSRRSSCPRPWSRAASRRRQRGQRPRLRDLAARQLRRANAARLVPPETPPGRLIDPGRARFRADGELHRYAPAAVHRSRPSPRRSRRRASADPRPGLTAAAAPAERDAPRSCATHSSTASPAVPTRRGRAREGHQRSLRRRRHEPRRASARGAPGGDDRHAACRRRSQYGEGGRIRPGTRRDPTGSVVTRGSSRSPRRASA